MRAALMLLPLMAACSLEPQYQRPRAPVPERFPQGEAYAAPAHDYRRPEWHQLIVSAQLQAVVQKALVHNRDLRVAAADIASARAQYALARAGMYPTIALTADASVRENLRAKLGPQLYELQVGTTAYEIDLFGRLRSQSHAAREAYFASVAGARAVRITLIADTATAWLNVAAQASLLAIARQTEVSAGESVRVTESRLSGGVSSELDVRQAQTILAQARSDVASYTTGVAQATNALVQLVGAELTNGDLPSELSDSGALLAEVPAGVASSVLLARPDVLQAEHALKSANANIGAARAAFFPTISLTALGGLMSEALSSLVSLGAAGVTLAPSVSLPLTTFGANQARLDYARAQRERYLADYERVIQGAFREVADALARRGTIEAQRQAQRELVAASESSYQLSDARYRAGADSYLNALDAQRTLYAARRTLVLTELTRAENLVTLYRVLGGG